MLQHLALNTASNKHQAEQQALCALWILSVHGWGVLQEKKCLNVENGSIVES